MRTSRAKGPSPFASCRVVATSVVAFLVLGCGSRTPEPRDPSDQNPTGEGEAAVEAPTPEALVIFPFQMGDHSGDDVMLHEDGRLSSERLGRDIGVLHADGRFVDPNGSLVATLRPDGAIALPDGALFELRITAEDTLRHRVREHLEVRIQDDGTIVGLDLAPQGQTSEESFGSVMSFVPAGRRTALYVLALATQLLGGD